MMLWARFLTFGDNNTILRSFYWMILILNGAVTIASISVSRKYSLFFLCLFLKIILFLLVSENSFEDVGTHYEIVLLVDFMVVAFSMLVISFWMLLYGARIYMRLRSSNITITKERASAFKALRRVNVVLAILVACSLLSIASLSVLMVDIILNTKYQERLGIFGWFIVSNWIPTLVPVMHCYCDEYSYKDILIEFN